MRLMIDHAVSVDIPGSVAEQTYTVREERHPQSGRVLRVVRRLVVETVETPHTRSDKAETEDFAIELADDVTAAIRDTGADSTLSDNRVKRTK